MEKPQFVSEHIYHLYNRGVEKRDIFLDRHDYLRFIHDLFEFNDTESVLPSNVRFALRNPRGAAERHLQQCLEVRPPNREGNFRKAKRLIEVLSYCLMPNHFHLMVRQVEEGGITKFMQKLGTGYAMYFNQKYERVGGLF
jgi:putative transposase